MIDLHCHILPGVDDGARSASEALEMARIAAADGIRIIACTPHVTPGIYDNDADTIIAGTKHLQALINREGIGVELVSGADVHIAPGLIRRLAGGAIPTLGGGRYFLFEPTHHVKPPRLEAVIVDLLHHGYVPVITHPERLTWLERHFGVIAWASERGALIQLTAGSLLGEFGRTALYWAEKLLDEGYVDLLASDAHDPRHRRPVLSRARDAVAARLGEAEAYEMVFGRPAAILRNMAVSPRPMRRERRVTMRETVGATLRWTRRMPA